MADDINYDELAFLTAGYSGAMLAGLCNSAAFVASREGRETITNRDMISAMDQEAAMQISKRVYSAERKRRYAVRVLPSCLPACLPACMTDILPALQSETVLDCLAVQGAGASTQTVCVASSPPSRC